MNKTTLILLLTIVPLLTVGGWYAIQKISLPENITTNKITSTTTSTTEISYYLLQSRVSLCDGQNMDSMGYKAALIKNVNVTEPGELSTEDKIKTTLRLGARAQSFNKIYARTDDITFENGIVTVRSASGWAGSSIFYCAWKPFVEKNLEQFKEIKEIRWQTDQ